MMVIAVADEKEILEFFTDVMRRNGYDGESIKFSDSFKAAELLGKYYGMFGDKHHDNIGDVIIVDNIAEKIRNMQS